LSNPIFTLNEFSVRAVGVPFVPHGRGYDGWDCYGLIVAAYRDVAGVTVPDFAYDSVSNYRLLARLFLDRKAPRWQPAAPRPMVAACIYRRGLPIHAGLVLPGRRVLHVEQGVDTCHEPMARFRIEGFYEPADSGTAPVPD